MASENLFFERIALLSPGRRILIGLTAINLLVFMGCLVGNLGVWRGWWHRDVLNLLGMPAELTLLMRRFWSPVTYMVTQGDVLHLLFNMLWLWWFGEVLTATQPPKTILIIYIAGGLSGAFFFFVASITGLFPSSLLIGSSASVLAIMAAAAVISPDTEFRFFLIGRIKLKYIAAVCAMLAFVGIGGGNSGGESAHLGGMLFGLFYGFSRKCGWRRNKTESAAMGRKFDKRLIKNLSKTSGREYARLDELLEKIRLSGFDSLSSKERNELSFLSRKLNTDH